jgi:hypothetical protein
MLTEMWVDSQALAALLEESMVACFIRFARVSLLGAMIAAAVTLASCSHDSGADNIIPADRPLEDSGADTDDTGTVVISPPAGPVLPSCLQGDNPSGCAVPPELPACLQGDEPAGCAEPPHMQDWSCPPGWSKASEGAGATWEYQRCEAPPPPPECPDGEVAVLDDSACHAVGLACPAGDFLDEASIHGLASGYAGKILYVKPGSLAGDGSIGSPFGSVGEAIAAAQAGDIVALAKATHTGSVELNTAIALVGACAGQTLVAAPSPDENAATIVIDGAGGALVANLTVSGARRGIWAQAGAALSSIVEVEVKASMRQGVYVSGAGTAVVMDEVAVRDTQSRASDKKEGNGLAVDSGASVKVSRGMFERNRDAAILISGAGSSVELSETIVRNTLSRESDKRTGNGLLVQSGAHAKAARARFDKNRDVAVDLIDAGSTVELTDVFVLDTLSCEDDLRGGGALRLGLGAQATVVRGLFERNRDVAVETWGAANTIEFTDVVVRNTLSRESDSTVGFALYISDGSVATITRSLIDQNRDIAIAVGDPGTSLTMTDTIVRDTMSRDKDKTGGWGLMADAEAQVTLSRTLFQRNHFNAISIYGPVGPVVMSDLTVIDTQGQENNGMHGVGLEVVDGGKATVQRGLFERNHDVAIFVYQNSSVDVTDTLVRETLSRPQTKTGGAGLAVQSTSKATVARSVFDRNRTAAIVVVDPGASIKLSDIVVRGTLSREKDKIGGRGLYVENGSQATVARAWFESNREASVSAYGKGGTMELVDIVVRDTQSQESDKKWGSAIVVQAGAKATLTRALLERSRIFEIGVAESGSSLEMTEVLARDTLGQESDGTAGRGLDANSGTHVVVKRSRFERNRDNAILVNGPDSTLDISDVMIRDIQSQTSDRMSGRGIGAQEGSVVKGTRVLLEKCREIAILAGNSTNNIAPASLDLSDLLIRDTLVRECASDATGPCVGDGVTYGAGTGAIALGGGSITLRQFEIMNSAMCGVQIVSSGLINLNTGLIHGNTIGANVQVEDYAYQTILNSTVRYFENGNNLDTQEMPVPDPGDVIPPMPDQPQTF